MNAIVISLFGQWRHLVEAPVLVADVKKAVEKGSVPSFDFFFMLATAGVIAVDLHRILSQVSPIVANSRDPLEGAERVCLPWRVRITVGHFSMQILGHF